jgi:hypothetical protein
MTYNLILLAVLLGVFALLFREGLWANTIALVNVTIAGLVATSYFEPLAALLSGVVGWIHIYSDLFSMALVFAAVYATLRFVAARLSEYRVRFHPVFDNAGSVVMALLTGWVTVCVFSFAMHLAPLSRVYLFSSFDPEQRSFFNLAPDRLWLGFAQSQSMGPLSAGREFDPKAEYMLKYASRRGWFETQLSMFPD